MSVPLNIVMDMNNIMLSFLEDTYAIISWNTLLSSFYEHNVYRGNGKTQKKTPRRKERETFKFMKRNKHNIDI